MILLKERQKQWVDGFCNIGAHKEAIVHFFQKKHLLLVGFYVK